MEILIPQLTRVGSANSRSKTSRRGSARFIFAAILLSAWWQSTVAFVVVDTGPGLSGNVGGVGLFYVPNPLDFQFLGVQFATHEDLVISSVEGWINFFGPATATVAIYTSDADLPGTELFSSAFLRHLNQNELNN